MAPGTVPRACIEVLSQHCATKWLKGIGLVGSYAGEAIDFQEHDGV